MGTKDTKDIRDKVNRLKKEGNFIDVTKGKKTKSIIFYTDAAGNQYGVETPLAVETIIGKMSNGKDDDNYEEE